jgi:hypothetical protein
MEADFVFGICLGWMHQSSFIYYGNGCIALERILSHSVLNCCFNSYTHFKATNYMKIVGYSLLASLLVPQVVVTADCAS